MANDPRLQRISIQDFFIYMFVLSIFHKEPVFPFLCWVPNKGTTGTIFITSLQWRGPWLGIEPWTSRTLPLGFPGGGIHLNETVPWFADTGFCINSLVSQMESFFELLGFNKNHTKNNNNKQPAILYWVAINHILFLDMWTSDKLFCTNS
mgnify:CR=1 FL=1